MKNLNFRDIAVWLVLAALVFPVAAAKAQDAEAPLGVHPHGSQTHWYPWECCSGTDCARIKVRIEKDHYVWESWRFPGFLVQVPVDPEAAAAAGVKIRPSQDGDFHGCEKHVNGPASGSVSGSFSATIMVGVEAICLFVPPST